MQPNNPIVAMIMIDDSSFPNWLATIPNYGKQPLYTTKLKMLISNGSYILLSACDPDGTDDTTVGRIVDYVCDSIVVNLYDVLRSGDSLSTDSSKAYGMKEIVQSRKKKVIKIKDVLDFAFVFTISDVDAGKVNPSGITNCFLIRYRSCNKELDDIGYTYTFPCESPLHIHFRTSTAHTIWHGIITIQDVLWKILNTVSQKQLMSSDKIPAFIDNTLWDYLLYRCSNVVKTRSPEGIRGKIRCCTSYGLKRTSTSVHKNSSLLRFQTKDQLKLLRQIFGDFSTMGCRRRRPKVGVVEKVQHNNKLNIVLGLEEEEKPFRNRTFHTCVDIGKDEFGSYVQVVYDSYLYSSSGIINYCDDDVSSDSYVVDMLKPLRESNRPNNPDYMIGLGCMVRRNNGEELLKIIRLTSTNASLEYILPKSRSGEVVIESDLNKITEEVNTLFQ